MAISPAIPNEATLEDRELATLASAGDGEAFAQLYDRHERRVFGFCLRMLDSEQEAAEALQDTLMRLLRSLPTLQGRDLDYVAYTLSAARSACYDAMALRRRDERASRRKEPAGAGDAQVGDGRDAASQIAEIVPPPESSGGPVDSSARVRAANADLPERQREALALREVEGLSYERIGQTMGLNSNAVAMLVARARIRLHDLLDETGSEPVVVRSPECERALPLLARVHDGESVRPGDLDWLHSSLADCESCRLNGTAMEQADRAYDMLGPIVVPAWLRSATLERAARTIGAGWMGPSDSDGAERAPQPATSVQTPRQRPRSASMRGALALASGVLLGQLRAHPSRWLLGLASVCALIAAVVTSGSAPERHVLLQQASPAESAAGPVHAQVQPLHPSLSATIHRHAPPHAPRHARATHAKTRALNGDAPAKPERHKRSAAKKHSPPARQSPGAKHTDTAKKHTTSHRHAAKRRQTDRRPSKSHPGSRDPGHRTRPHHAKAHAKPPTRGPQQRHEAPSHKQPAHKVTPPAPTPPTAPAQAPATPAPTGATPTSPAPATPAPAPSATTAPGTPTTPGAPTTPGTVPGTPEVQASGATPGSG